MDFNNQIVNIRKSLSAELLKLYFEDRLEDEIDKIPIKRYPKNSSNIRCCIYKDRAMMRYRIMSLLGIDVETQDDEFKSLKDYSQDALQRDVLDEKLLTIIDIACASCKQDTYSVTDLCKACEARPCEKNCPVNCIQIINGRAIIDQSKCINCGKCEKVCPYNAISYSPVPCEVKCPVNAIARNEETGKEEIDYSKCIYCGRCTRACPFGTIMERSEIIDVAKHLKNPKQKVVALVAPSIIGQFPGQIGQMLTAIKVLGFETTYEVAYGADITARNEAKELIEILAEGQPILGTSCCPAYVESVNKHVPNFKKYISHTKTPMAYTAELAKSENPEAITVFIGPCIAKKFEGTKDVNTDFVLTFEELGSFFWSKGIEISELDECGYATDSATVEAKGFCVDGGVTAAVKHYAKLLDPEIEVKPLYINGLDKKGLNLLKAAGTGKLKNNLVECMSCEGGCLAGPGVIVPKRISEQKLKMLRQ
ncbi:MAG: monomeric [FeFe] hydrogenase [Lentisphaeria bacterium]|nr:monomeric [FeFe] hydrogenase [Lentisphaeria bacterium]